MCMFDWFDYYIDYNILYRTFIDNFYWLLVADASQQTSCSQTSHRFRGKKVAALSRNLTCTCKLRVASSDKQHQHRGSGDKWYQRSFSHCYPITKTVSASSIFWFGVSQSKLEQVAMNGSSNWLLVTLSLRWDLSQRYFIATFRLYVSFFNLNASVSVRRLLTGLANSKMHWLKMILWSAKFQVSLQSSHVFFDSSRLAATYRL